MEAAEDDDEVDGEIAASFRCCATEAAEDEGDDDADVEIGATFSC